MKCANCDAEIKDGSIYCPVCGKEAQMVNGYVSLEEDFLHSLLREELNASQEEVSLSLGERKKNSKKKQLMPVVVVSLIAALVLMGGIVIKLLIDNKNNNSYEYQVKMAEAELFDHNYESALAYLARALALVPEDIESRMEMAEIYLLQEKDDAALVLLTEIIRIDADYKKAYEAFISIYAENEQYDRIVTLSEYTDNAEIKALFKDYLVAAPTIYPSGDTFYDELNVTISSDDNNAIYYTTDGTDPAENGQRYIEGVGITFRTSGLYTVKAVCRNKNGIYGEVVSHNYQIVLTPKQPEIVTNDTEQTGEEGLETIEEQ